MQNNYNNYNNYTKMEDDDQLFIDTINWIKLDSDKKIKRQYKSKHCDICNKTISHEHNFPIHEESDIHIRNVEKMYKQPCSQESAKKRKLPEEFSNALELHTSLKEKKTDPTEMR